MLTILEVATIVLAGWLAGAESGSWSCVHPVIAKLEPDDQIRFQKGLLKTFGRIMPVLMPLSLALAILLCSFTEDKSSPVFYLRLAAVILLATMIVTTVVFNVPVNIQTGEWAAEYNREWVRKRKIWRFFQGYRSIVLILAFIVLVIAQTNQV